MRGQDASPILTHMRVLNIPVTPELTQRWRGFLAPERQPFYLTAAEAERLALDTVPRREAGLTPEERDTFWAWNVASEADRVAWLSRGGFAVLSASTRRELLRLQVRHGRGNVPLGQHYVDLLPELGPGRFLWEAEQLTPAVLARVLAGKERPCRREKVPETVWNAAAAALPRARELAGTFSAGPGNCFGAVMGAAGVGGAENTWTGREEFDAFVEQCARKGGNDDQPGTLLVWTSAQGVEHAAVTLGGGWAFHKPSQLWSSPRVVLPLRELIRASRTPGRRLQRLQLQPS